MVWRPKIQDDANDTKLKGRVKDLEALDRRLILCAKNTGSWLTVHRSTVTGTVLAAAQFRFFLCAHYDVNTPNLQKNVMVALSPLMYATDLAAVMADSSLPLTTKCMTR